MANTELVYEVTSVKLVVEKSTLTIYADRVARTPGYTNPLLQPLIYIQPPPDGIWGFEFVADKPDGIVMDVLTPISAKYEWKDYPAEVKGVEVIAATNSIIENTGGKYD